MLFPHTARKSLALLLGVIFALLFTANGAPHADAQQDASPKQTLVINYPNSGVVIADGVAPYRGIIYVKVFPVGADLVKKYAAGPIATAQLTASGRDVRSLPLGAYEIQFSMRQGSALKTFVVRDVILRADRASQYTVQMNDTAKTTIIGGDMTAQQMADTIRDLQTQLADLKQQVAALKAK